VPKATTEAADKPSLLEGKMTRCLLINPQMPFNGSENDSWIRLGLAHLSSVLKQDGHEVFLIDFRCMSGWPAVFDRISDLHPDIVFITAFTTEVQTAIELARGIKAMHPGVVTVIGGIHASIAPEDYVKAGCFDIIVRGEGEITVKNIADNFMIGRPDSIQPMTVWGEVPNLDTIPLADRELWPDYAQRITHPPVWLKEGPFVELLNSRGCPFKCFFCCGPGEQNHFSKERDGRRVPNVRSRSVARTIEELQMLDSKYHFRSVQCHDDQFILNPQWNWDLVDALKENGLDDKRWWIGTRADILLRNKDLLLAMQKVGLDIVSVGFESFSDPLLKFWNKGTTAKMNHDAAQWLVDHDFRMFSNTIMGSPRGDGKWYEEDDRSNIEAIKKYKPAHISLSIFTPTPGCDLYKWAVENDMIIAQDLGCRGDNERKMRGVNYHKVWLMMDEVIEGRRPFYHNWYDRALVTFGLDE
jgi:radical SAM superfamily enzyme YgiQ (UPF0313 family)